LERLKQRRSQLKPFQQKCRCLSYKVTIPNGVKEHLEDKDKANVLTTKVNSTGSIDERDVQLREQVLQALGKNGHIPPPVFKSGRRNTYYCPLYGWAWIAVIFYNP
jgi:hypothetical protein